VGGGGFWFFCVLFFCVLVFFLVLGWFWGFFVGGVVFFLVWVGFFFFVFLGWGFGFVGGGGVVGWVIPKKKKIRVQSIKRLLLPTIRNKD